MREITGSIRAERPKGVQDSFLIISVKSVLQSLEFGVHA
jgi:hypothetical protein